MRVILTRPYRAAIDGVNVIEYAEGVAADVPDEVGASWVARGVAEPEVRAMPAAPENKAPARRRGSRKPRA